MIFNLILCCRDLGGGDFSLVLIGGWDGRWLGKTLSRILSIGFFSHN
jgi:hypothetical protein